MAMAMTGMVLMVLDNEFYFMDKQGGSGSEKKQDKTKTKTYRVSGIARVMIVDYLNDCLSLSLYDFKLDNEFYFMDKADGSRS